MTTRHVLIPRFCELTGYTDKAVRRKIEDGVWQENKEWRRAPDGHVMIDLEWYVNYMNSEIKKADPPLVLMVSNRREPYAGGFVYFIMQRETKSVKIGFSSSKMGVHARFLSLKTASPSALELLAYFPCHYSHERLVHKILAGKRRAGEWFQWCNKIEHLIESCRSIGLRESLRTLDASLPVA